MVKLAIKSIKSQDEFDSYLVFIDNTVKVYNEVRSVILSRISIDKQYYRNVLAQSGKRNNYLDGFIIEKVWFLVIFRKKTFKLFIFCTVLEHYSKSNWGSS